MIGEIKQEKNREHDTMKSEIGKFVSWFYTARPQDYFINESII